jgi:hypothetical protein
MHTVADIIGMLKETSEWEEEWGGNIFELISVYNHKLAASESWNGARRKKGVKVQDDDDVEQREPRAKKVKTGNTADRSLAQCTT